MLHRGAAGTVREVKSVLEPIFEVVSLEGKNVIDVGCGTGDVARALSEHGARVIGVDRPEMLAKARIDESSSLVHFLDGGAQRLPVASGSAELVLFLASLHHVPPAKIPEAVGEAHRVLCPGGQALFIEPLVECSYYLITRLAEEETEARRHAHEAIRNAGTVGFRQESEDFFFIKRSFEDFRYLLDLHWEESEELKRETLARAEAIAHTLAAGASCTIDQYRFQSACRLNLLRKPANE
jgi:ubiquinone/menaquinone biosynthesis C-methylase UbiE